MISMTKYWHHLLQEGGERKCASSRVDAQQRAVQANINSDSYHNSQDPPNPCWAGQALLTPIVMTKLEHIKKVFIT